jgi:hypothetical protein
MKSTAVWVVTVLALSACAERDKLPTDPSAMVPGEIGHGLARGGGGRGTSIPAYELVPSPSFYQLDAEFGLHPQPATESYFELACVLRYSVHLTRATGTKPGEFTLSGQYEAKDRFGSPGFCNCRKDGQVAEYARPIVSGTVTGTMKGNEINLTLGGEIASARLWGSNSAYFVSSNPPLNFVGLSAAYGGAAVALTNVGACGSLSGTVQGRMFSVLVPQ